MQEDIARTESLDRGSEGAVSNYRPESQDYFAGQQLLADKYKSDINQRKVDYKTGTRRDSSSYGVLKDMALSIVDGDQHLVGQDVVASRQMKADTAKPAESGAIGDSGNRPIDAGAGIIEKPVVVKDSQGSVTQFRTPDGKQFEVDYATDQNGNKQPVRIILPDEDGRPRNIVRSGGKWINRDDEKQETGILDVRLGPDGSVTVVQDSYGVENKATGKTKIYNQRMFKYSPDGTYAETDMRGKDVYENFDKNGAYHKYTYEKRGDDYYRSEKVQEPGSHIRQVSEGKYDSKTDQFGSEVKGYEVIDDQGHVTSLTTNKDFSCDVVRGDKKEHFDSYALDRNGAITLQKKDNSNLEISKDGTQIRRNSKGQVTEITNSDGEVTTFTRGALGKVTDVKITDGQGNEVKSDHPPKVLKINDRDGTYVIEKDADHKVERKADGTEKLLDKNGKPTESDADKLLSKFKNYTPEQEHQLRQDLAAIDKLPEDQRKKVYESLDRIARNDEHPEQHVTLTGQQARELVASLAHQIAHPEAIRQGCKMTCVVASTEQTIARNHPEVYADMVAKLATDGQYTAADGRVVKVQGYDNQALDPKTDAYGQRSYASELFQNAGVQLALESPKEYVSYGPFDYGHLEPRPKGVTPSRDRGERVIDRSTNPPTVTDFDGLLPEQQAKLLSRIVPGDGYKPTAPITTVDELGQAAEHGLPMTAAVHLGKEKFTGMSAGNGATDAGNHAVTVTHIEYDQYDADGKPAAGAKPVKVYFENTAGGNDHSYPNGTGVDAQEFVDAMKSGKIKMRAMVSDKQHP